MTAAARTVRACQAGAFLSAASAGYSATHHPYLVLPGLAAAAFLLWGAASARGTEQRRRARTARLDHAAASDAAVLDTDDRSAA
ncbi:hypothetical protein ABTX71_12880 [Streptomyces parvulus]|uniref:hypothetical protein n=1 Tax=Streptomyces parvulus TaxID=146923 RepID=UPI003332FEEB